jgi:hypothetical protein
MVLGQQYRSVILCVRCEPVPSTPKVLNATSSDAMAPTHRLPARHETKAPSHLISKADKTIQAVSIDRSWDCGMRSYGL